MGEETLPKASMKKLLASLFAIIAVSAAQAGVDVQSLTSFTATTTSTVALAQNTQRKYLLVQNRGAVSVYLKFDSAHSGTEGITVSAGGNYTEACSAPTDSIFIRSDSSTALVTVYEGIGDCNP
jgi:hypothetical protein